MARLFHGCFLFPFPFLLFLIPRHPRGDICFLVSFFFFFSQKHHSLTVCSIDRCVIKRIYFRRRGSFGFLWKTGRRVCLRLTILFEDYSCPSLFNTPFLFFGFDFVNKDGIDQYYQ